VAAKAALVVSRAHEDTVDRTGVHAQSAEHALCVVDLEPGDAEAFADRVFHLVDVDAVDRACLGALVAADASGQVEAMETPIARLHRHRSLRILKLLRECFSAIGLNEIPKRDVHSLPDGLDGEEDVLQPGAHYR